MLELNYETYRKKLLKDLYKLKEQLKTEESFENKLKIMDGIASINLILEEYLLICDKNYNYQDIIKNNSNTFIELKKLEYDNVKNNMKTLKRKSRLNTYIYNSTKKEFKNLRHINNEIKIFATHISRKQFYDILFNLPFGDFNEFLTKHIKGKKLYTLTLMDYDNNLLDGVSYSMPSLNYDYSVIETYDEYSYLSMFPIIHEISHSYVERKYNINTCFNIFREVISFFNEFRLMDYLEKNYMVNNDIIINYFEILKNMESNLKNRFKFKRFDDYNKFMYIIGPLVSFSFFEIYKKDPEKCNFYTNYFCTNINNYEPYELLEKSNINVEELSSGDVMKRIIKSYNNYYDKFKS